MIKDNLLQGVPFIRSPNQSGIIKPEMIVLHYTASGEGNDAKYFQNKAAKASAHLVIERDGSITQCVRFNKKAWHAGKSTWKGRPNCNNWSIGIEIDNWGLLTKLANGDFISHTGKVVAPDKVMESKNKLGNGQYWEIYNAQQLKVVEEVVEELLDKYPSIKEVVGHEDISPRRKIDPGPALYDFVRKMNNKPNGGRKSPTGCEVRTVIASRLNVRAGPSTSHAVIGKILRGDRVIVEYDSGAWCKLSSPLGEAWVYDRFLR